MCCIRNIIVSLIACVAVTVHATGVFEPMLHDPELAHASLGVHIVNADTREVVASYDAQRAFTPASVVKTVTAASLMKSYAPSQQWNTQVFYTGYIADSTLYGDIVVKGAMDPSLGHSRSSRSQQAFVDTIVSKIKQASVTSITGHVIVDVSCCIPGGWSDWMIEDIGAYYGAPCYGVNYKGNAFNLYVNSGAEGSQPVIKSASLCVPDIEYHNYMRVGVKDSSFSVSHPFSSQILLMGIVPPHRTSYAVRCANPNPPMTLAHEVVTSLRSNNIEIEGEPRVYHREKRGELQSMNNGTLLYTHASDSLYDMLRTMMIYSENLYAESLLNYLALTVDSVATQRVALDVERRVWDREGLDMSGMNLHDGSGLSRKNTLTPQFLASLLVEAHHDNRLGKKYQQLFPIAGKEGTARSFTARNPLPGLLRIKSGSMAGVLCYVGYYTHDSHTYAIVMMCNNHTCSNAHVRGLYEQLLHRVLARHK